MGRTQFGVAAAERARERGREPLSRFRARLRLREESSENGNSGEDFRLQFAFPAAEMVRVGLRVCGLTMSSGCDERPDEGNPDGGALMRVVSSIHVGETYWVKWWGDSGVVNPLGYCELGVGASYLESGVTRIGVQALVR
ncbi:hypothetical protein L1987_23111 [Smallanthus sonchifolius]|uniref:Uncharacterized protein n=1 Tax=Smallanthus sonchifolius TaxID=185202 RepID=A0ACB9IHB9_9ASTR|nr:hypothetical protein L1987_23111 [Smallanthus sonchifolius]